MFRRKWRMTKIVGCFLSVLICISAIASCANYRVKAAPSTDQIMFGEYYRIRNGKTGSYLTMNSLSDTSGVGCSQSVRSNYNKGQIFYLGIDNKTNTYYLSPMSSPSKKVLTLTGAGSSTNLPLSLEKNLSVNTQKWTLSRTTPGYRIVSYANITNAFSNIDWRFEPAYSGSASYFMTVSDLSSSNSVIVNDAVSKIKALGYDCERVDLPVTGHIRFATPGNRLTVFHGHGSPGHMKLDQKDGTFVRMYSENAPSGNLTLNFSTTKNSLVVFIVCKSATASSDRMSLQDAAWYKGANTVMAFQNNVTGGEEYLKIVLDNMRKNPSATVYDSMKSAMDYYTEKQLQDKTCPANLNNVLLVGPPVSINMN